LTILLTESRIPSGGITTFGPLIVNSFGFSPFNTILLNIPFGAVQIIATMGAAAFATWTKKKGPALAMLCIPPIAGTVMLLTIEHTTANKAPLLVGYYLISFYPGICKFLPLSEPCYERYMLMDFSTSDLFLVFPKYCW
jgi:hypothetical protein